MKSSIAVLACAAFLILALNSPTSAESKYNMAGCGLGSMMFVYPGELKDKINDAKIRNVLAVTTNETGSQTFAITTGTSNCTQDGVALQEKELELFAEINFDDLSRDMAQGQGEYLTAVATLMGCSAEAQPRFAEQSQAHYEAIYASDETSPRQVLKGLQQMLHDDAQLSQSCSRI